MVLVIKKGDKLEFVESWDYSKDREEKILHKLVEQNPQFIIRTEEENKPVLTIGSKMNLPSGELDLLFADNEGSLTLVELKRGRSPRDVVAQILDYASSLSEMSLDVFESYLNRRFRRLKEVFDEFRNNDLLPSEEFTVSDFKDNVKNSLVNIKLIITSYNITENIKKVTNWLRNTYSVPIFCVEFEYFKKGDHEFFMPKMIGEEMSRKLRAKRRITTIQKKYYKFFEILLQEFKRKKLGVTDRGSTYDDWLDLPSGYGSSIHFEWIFHKREPNKILGVELHFENSDRNVNLKLLEHFKQKREELERKIGEELSFEKWGKSNSRIYIRRFVGTLEDGIKNRAMRDWATDAMIRFYEIFKPELDRIVPTMR